MSKPFTIPFGSSKGTPIEAAEDKDLNYCIEASRKKLTEDPNGNYAEANRRWIAAAEAELRRRASGGAVTPGPVAPPPLENKAIQAYCGAYRDAGKATEIMSQLREIGHLVSPAPACGSLPEGTALVISSVMVDVDNETFPLTGGKLGLGKVPTYKISGALGVSWNSQTGQLDDGSNPLFVDFNAAGYVRQLDGSKMYLSGKKRMDLREGSAQIAAMKDQAETKYRRELDDWEKRNKTGKPPAMGNWENQVRDKRYRILELAETMAKLRAIRSLGIRQSFTKDELMKPFFAVKLQFTGQSEDPVIRQMFARMIAESFLGSKDDVYGAPEPLQIERPQAGYSPPPVRNTRGESLEDPDGLGLDDDDDFPH